MRNLSLGFPTRPDTNRDVQLQKLAKGLKFRTDCTIFIAKTKALISCAVTCAFVFAYAKSRFSHEAAHMRNCHEFQWKEIPADQLMDSKLKCVFEMPTSTGETIVSDSYNVE